MSQIPRKSLMPQGPMRRSSSANNQEKDINHGGRSSSIGGRASSIGGFRPSICNFKTTDGKTITPADLAASILKVLEDLDYTAMPVSIKILQLPSTQLFYSIFEFFLKHIGIDDVWNAEYLSTSSDQKLPPSSQTNNVEKNKLRIELIIYYLDILKFNNVPKPSVLQTMTTPKNWTHMLQIMHFLANDSWFLVCYDAEKVLEAYVGKFNSNHIIYDYAKRTYALTCKDAAFLDSDRHKEMKLAFFERYEKTLRGDNDLAEIENDKNQVKMRLEKALQVKKDYEDAVREEQNLINRVKEKEQRSAARKVERDEREKRIMIKKQNQLELKKQLIKKEEEINVQDEIYDKQVKSGAKMDNLQNKHAQKNKELDALQTIFVDLENKRDEIQMQIMNRTMEVKSVISEINEMVHKIKLSSSIEINEFPQFDILDFHKKGDLIKEYKDGLTVIRKKYNDDICKLPEQLAYHREQKKMVDTQVKDLNAKIQALEVKIEDREEILKRTKEECDNCDEDFKQKMKSQKKEVFDLEDKESRDMQELNSISEEVKELEEKLRQTKEEKRDQIKNEQESCNKLEEFLQEHLHKTEKKCVENIKAQTALLEGFVNDFKIEK